MKEMDEGARKMRTGLVGAGGTQLSGFLNINKPLKWTSFDCVNKVAWVLKDGQGTAKKAKVGHSGTLDPLATGVLVLGVGKGTKGLEQMKGDDKDYVAEIALGIKSASFDLDGEIEVVGIEGWDEILEAAKNGEWLDDFRGEIEQMPPKFSALKVGGKRAYDLARAGKEFKLEPRKVRIDKLEVLECGMKEVEVPMGMREDGRNGEVIKVKLPVIKIFATVSKGTYIRALARDIGEKLGAPGCLISLVRTRVGKFKIEDSISFSKETVFESLKAGLYSMDTFSN